VKASVLIKSNLDYAVQSIQSPFSLAGELPVQQTTSSVRRMLLEAAKAAVYHSDREIDRNQPAEICIHRCERKW
jgi:hypothetical protein